MGWSARPPVRNATPKSALGRVAAFLIPGLAALLISSSFPAGAQTTPPDSVAALPDSVAALPDSAAASSPAPQTTFVPADWETLSAGLPEAARVGPVVRLRYNRVDGAAVQLGGKVSSEREPRPLLYAAAGYAFARERFLYDAGFEAPIGDPARFRVGGAVYRRTATEDGWIVGETENTFFALFAWTDYRDHFEAEGWEATVTWEPGADFALAAGVSMEDLRSLATEAHFSIFGEEDEFRPNPAIEDGEQGVLSLSARLGPSPVPSEGGTAGEITYESAGGVIDGDFEYGRVRGKIQTRTRLSPRQEARARVIGGSTVDGDLPSQKIWHLGGISTLRGHGYKKFNGDQFLLANVEYYFLARKNVWTFAFLDWGAAWFGSDNLDRQQFSLDGGIGVRLGQGPIAVTAARNLQDSGAPILVGVRLGGSF